MSPRLTLGRERPLVPTPISRRARLARAAHRAARPLRRRYYAEAEAPTWSRRIAAPWRGWLGLDDDDARGSRRIEVGSGLRPTPGFVHVDLDPYAPHVEFVAPAWSLPFADGWATELVASHTLEHVHPRLLAKTLREWRRVLDDGGCLRVAVPNGSELAERFATAAAVEKWPFMAAILGMYVAPDVRRPAQISWPATHQIIFDSDLLRSVLEEADFREVTDLTGRATDVHTEAWRPLVNHFSLIFEARK
jgi:predicted SAM-dependent methyltransferase